jgi:hypothetical protein
VLCISAEQLSVFLLAAAPRRIAFGGRIRSGGQWQAKVIPELQKRGLFRREYEGATLRENLGLPRPENRFFSV